MNILERGCQSEIITGLEAYAEALVKMRTTLQEWRCAWMVAVHSETHAESKTQTEKALDATVQAGLQAGLQLQQNENEPDYWIFEDARTPLDQARLIALGAGRARLADPHDAPALLTVAAHCENLEVHIAAQRLFLNQALLNAENMEQRRCVAGVDAFWRTCPDFEQLVSTQLLLLHPYALRDAERGCWRVPTHQPWAALLVYLAGQTRRLAKLSRQALETTQCLMEQQEARERRERRESE